MRWLLWKLGMIDLVNVFWNSGTTPNVRVVHYDKEGRRFIEAITGLPKNELKPNGEIIPGPNHRYSMRWTEYTGIRKQKPEKLRWFRPHARRMFGRLTAS